MIKIFITLKFMVSLVFLMASFFLYSCKKEVEPVGPCKCETYEFPYLGLHDITSLKYFNNNEFRYYDVSYDFSGSLIAEFTDSSSFIIDCNVLIDTLNIDFYMDGSYGFDHACTWTAVANANGKFDWCKMTGIGTLDIKNTTNFDLHNQTINFYYDFMGASIIIPLANNSDKIKILVTAY